MSSFPVPGVVAAENVAAGAGGSAWFVAGSSLEHVNAAGVVTAAYPVSPAEITVGADGDVWFSGPPLDPPLSNATRARIDRLDPATGAVSSYPLPPGGSAGGLTAGPDGNVWFTDYGNDAVGSITPAGVITEYPVPSGESPGAIVSGPGGELWFAESSRAGALGIGAVTTSGTFTEHPVPAGTGDQGSYLQALAAGPDGNVWFIVDSVTDTGPSYFSGGYLGQMTPSGTVTQFPGSVPQNDDLTGITAGPDGNLWVTAYYNTSAGDAGDGVIIQVTTSGAATQFRLGQGSDPSSITTDPDGTIWFTDQAGTIGTITFAGSPLAPTATMVSSSGDPSVVGGVVVYTATVTGPSGTLPGSGETVAFDDGGTPIAHCAAVELTTAAPYTASCAVTYTSTSGSPHSITAAYAGDTANAPSVSAPISQAVNLAGTSTTVASSADPSGTGQTVTYTATVTPAPDGGTVAFSDAGQLVTGCASRPVSSGTATCAVKYTAAGSHTITAAYSGNANYNPSASHALGQTVTSCGQNLSGCNLSGVNLSGANLSGVNLSGANLKGATLTGTDLSGANLSGANLAGASMSGADLAGANLSGANLKSANLSGANLTSANLTGANLSGANFTNANLTSATLTGANLNGATWSSTTCPDGTNSNSNTGHTCTGHL